MILKNPLSKRKHKRKVEGKLEHLMQTFESFEDQQKLVQRGCLPCA